MALPPAQSGTLHPTRAIAALLEAHRDAIWFDESGLSTSDVRQWMEPPLTMGYSLIALFLSIPAWIGFAVWIFVDGILMLAGRPIDGQGRPLRP